MFGDRSVTRRESGYSRLATTISCNDNVESVAITAFYELSFYPALLVFVRRARGTDLDAGSLHRGVGVISGSQVVYCIQAMASGHGFYTVYYRLA
jgi:hypothetical protein